MYSVVDHNNEPCTVHPSRRDTLLRIGIGYKLKKLLSIVQAFAAAQAA